MVPAEQLDAGALVTMRRTHDELHIGIDGKNLLMRLAGRAKRYNQPAAIQLSEVVTEAIQAIAGLLQSHQPAHLLVAWDKGRSHHRLLIYPDYKANHDLKSPDQQALVTAISVITPVFQRILTVLGIPQLECDDVEADDLLALTTRHWPGPHMLLTTDCDYWQLISDRVTVYNPMRSLHITPSTMTDLTGLEPSQWLDYKALVGDTGDHIPGIHGIGPKTATQLLQEFRTLDNILACRAQVAERIPRGQLLLAPDAEWILRRNILLMTLHSLPNEWHIKQQLPALMDGGPAYYRPALAQDYLHQAQCHQLLSTWNYWIPYFEHLDSVRPGLNDMVAI